MTLTGLAAPEPAPTGLMCDLLALTEQVEIIHPQPRLSWIMHSNGKDAVQSAYEIRVAPTPAALSQKETCLWESGEVASDQSTAVAYAGPELTPGRAYCWQVRTWNQQKQVSEWSAAQRFRLGASPDDRVTTARYPLQITSVTPARIVALGGGHYFLDFGRTAFGGLVLTLTSPTAGGAVTVHMSETLAASNRVNRAPGGSIRYHRAEVTLQAGTHTYTVPLEAKDARRMPPEIGPVMPFRYVEIENSPSAVTLETARQQVAQYPFDDNAARFDCSDPKLNAIWELCHHTMKATSFCGLFVDGDRERLPYEADAYINQLGYYACDREYTLARYSQEYLILHPTWPTEWQSHSVMMAWEDYLATGDDRSMAAFYPHLKAKTLCALARPDGLISTVDPPVSAEVLATLHNSRLEDIVDWPRSERDGYEMRPVNSVVNAFHYRSLVLMARIAGALHKPENARFFQTQASLVQRSFNAVFYDTQTGLYVDGEGSRHSSQHANMFALAFGLAPPEYVAHVAAFVAGRGMACSVYGSQYLLEALYDSGLAEEAHALMTAPTDRSWAHMVYDLQATMTLEAWDNKYKPNQDWNHAWGAAPANIIPRKLMGVEATEPGFRRMRIRPQPGALAQASLDLPTIRGTVHVAFESSPARFTLHVTLPANTAAEIVLPRLGSEDSSVLVDGVARQGRLVGNTIVLDSIGSGAHTLVRANGPI